MKVKFILCLLLIATHFVFPQSTRTATYCLAIPIIENNNGKVANRIYTCHTFDWKISIPDGYDQIDLKMSAELKEKGPDALKESVSNGYKFRRDSTYLICFGSNNTNTFTSSWEPIDTSKTTTTLALHKTLTLRHYNEAYAKLEGVTFQSSSSLLTIGKYDFYRIYVTFYNAKTNAFIKTQEIYNSIMANHLFSVSIQYDNEKTRRELISNFMDSLKN